MRKIKIKPLIDDEWKKWRKKCKEARRKCIATIAKGKKPIFNKIYKQKYIKDEYFFNEKKGPFYGKCAYCEAYIVGSQYGDVEHFRPKGGITDEKGNIIYLKDSSGKILTDKKGDPKPHPGYYWLAYYWKNLLPSCIHCNRPQNKGDKKTGKRTRFPVRGVHAQNPFQIRYEEPLLLNPIDSREDEPEQHFTINEKGFLHAKTDRGQACIDILDLNRDNIREGREYAFTKVRDLYCRLVNAIFSIANDEDESIQQIQRIQYIQQELEELSHEKYAFTFALRAAIKQYHSKIRKNIVDKLINTTDNHQKIN